MLSKPATHTILEGIARGVAPGTSLRGLAQMIEEDSPDLRCVICVLTPGAAQPEEVIAPGLPDEFRLAACSIDFRDPTGSPCTRSVSTRAEVDIADTESDAEWAGTAWRELALRHELHSCHVTPLFDPDRRVVATFTIYGRRKGQPIPHTPIIDNAIHLARIAIERWRNEAALRESEERLRLAVEGAEMGTWDYNFATGELICSDLCNQMFGLTGQATPRYEHFLSAVHPEDRPEIERVTRESLENGGTFDLDFRVNRPDGTMLWIAALGRAFGQKDAGAPTILRGVALDITARKTAEREAAEGAERFRFLAESLPEKIFTTTPSGSLAYLNEQWARYTGQPVEEVLRRGWRDFVHPDDIEEKDALWTAAVEAGTPFEFEHRFQRSDGAYRWHLSRAKPMRRADGSITMWVGSNIDVDDLKQAQFELSESESRLRLAMEAAGLGFWDWHLGGQMRWSREHSLMMGLDPTQLEGTLDTALQHVPADDRRRVLAALARSREARHDFEVEFRVAPPGVPIRWITAHVRAYYDEQDGRPVRMIGVIRDVTSRREAENKLRRNQEELRAALQAAEHAREQAEAASRAKDQFLAVLSHELRTPLTPVLMAVSATAMDPNLPASIREAMEMIQRNIKIEARLIEDLLDLTRIARNKMEILIEPMDLHSALREALEICRSDIDTKKHRLVTDLAATQTLVQGDRERLQQVFWNLIKNAVKFTPEGGEIVIRSYNLGGRICVEVRDSGIGIPAESLPFIFNPFEQGDQAQGRRFGGLGLGLAISKATMDALGGVLSVESPGKGRGATFTVALLTTSH